jgi:hypothetical protein
MVCEHLAPLEAALLRAGIAETFRGRAWTQNCREWVYFACVLDRVAVRVQFCLPPCVEDHIHRGTHDGSEAGFVCTLCWDGVLGAHPSCAGKLPVFSGVSEARATPDQAT